MKRRVGSRGVTVRDRPPDKLRHAPWCPGSWPGVCVPKRRSRQLFESFRSVPSSGYPRATILTPPTRPLSSQLARCVSPHLQDSHDRLALSATSRLLRFSDKLTGLRVPATPVWKHICPRGNIDTFGTLEIYRSIYLSERSILNWRETRSLCNSYGNPNAKYVLRRWRIRRSLREFHFVDGERTRNKSFASFSRMCKMDIHIQSLEYHPRELSKSIFRLGNAAFYSCSLGER